MTTTAILFLLLAAFIIWGGLAVSIALLRRDGRLAAGSDDELGEQEPPRRDL